MGRQTGHDSDSHRGCETLSRAGPTALMVGYQPWEANVPRAQALEIFGLSIPPSAL